MSRFVKVGAVTRAYNLGQRVKSMEQTRRRILDAAWVLTEAAGFELVSIDEIAERAGVGRATIFRQFGSKAGVHEAALWHRMAQVDLDRVDAAHELPDPVDALAAVLRANCEMFDQIGEALTRCLEVARTDTEMRHLIELSYLGRRVDSMTRLARRLDDAGALAPGWTRPRVVDALVVLTSIESYRSLTQHRARSTDRAAETLFAMASAFLAPRKLGSDVRRHTRIPGQ